MNHKNSAYQRGASRQQPQPATTVNAAASAPAKNGVPGWLWLACGMIIGTCAVFLINLNSGDNSAKSPEVGAAPAAPAEAPAASVATEANEQHKPKYDFYTLLPDSKVILPPNMEEDAAPPAPAAPAPTEAALAGAAGAAAALAAAPVAAALVNKAVNNPPPSAPSSSSNAVALKPPTAAVTVTTNTPPKQPVQPVVKPAPAPAPVAVAKPAPVQPIVTPAPTQAKLQPVPPAPAVAPTPAPTQAKLQPIPAAPTPPPAPAASTPAPAAAPAKPQQLFLQAGSYRKSDDADRMRAEMLLMGVNARVESSVVRGETWHRVLVGPYSNQDKMNQARKQLSENGFNSLIPQKR